MRFTAVIVVFAAAGCFNPRISDGGFACNPADPVPCPEGLHCRDDGSGFVCTRRVGPVATPGSGADLGSDDSGAAVDLAMPPSGPADQATPPPDMATPPANCGVAQLVINEVQTGGSSASDEFIEIYNPCASSVTVTGSLVYRASAGTSDIKLADLNNKAIGKQGYLVAANSGYKGTTDIAFNGGTGLNDTGGGVALLDGNGKTINAMGWGDANNAFVQGNAAKAATASHSMARTPNGANTHHDDVDFQVASTPTPRAAN